MSKPASHVFKVSLDDAAGSVSATATVPDVPAAAYVFAHGAGAGMQHDFMTALSAELATAGVAVLRFNFPYMESGRRAPDRQPVLIRTVRCAVQEARTRFSGVPLFAGGKSMGGRMTSLAYAETPLSGVRGLIFMGFPLHAAGKPGSDRAAHLRDIDIPLLFFQGTSDRLADLDLMRSVIENAGAARATLFEIEGADHSFRVPKRCGRTREQILADVAVRARNWMTANAGERSEAQ